MGEHEQATADLTPVRVRLFAALRDAAGTATTEVAVHRLPQLLAALGDRYGQLFASRLQAASVVIDGVPVARDADADLTAVDEVVLLPPFSGG